jgi:hypothetical protein
MPPFVERDAASRNGRSPNPYHYNGPAHDHTQ